MSAELNRIDLLTRYNETRAFSESFCLPLETEDYVVQTMPDVSPTKWHLAHTSWFFETFVLQQALPKYYTPDPQYAYLYNSYYNAIGDRHCRPRRGLLSRPTVDETYTYRAHVDQYMRQLLTECTDECFSQFADIVDLGIHHEQQHQELMVTDIKHVLGTNPLHPSYHSTDHVDKNLAHNTSFSNITVPLTWTQYRESIPCVGHEGGGFSFDNEGPRHRALVPDFAICDRPVTIGEYLDFITDGGYRRAEHWLSAGWNTVQENDWEAPLYWVKRDDEWFTYTMFGLRPVNRAEPVCHVSYFEADAFAQWFGGRLPTEFEWEFAARDQQPNGTFADGMEFHPQPVQPVQWFGSVWEWTRSQYSPYPGYATVDGALGEYNGKFMCNQFVLRGGSCATSRSHIRPTYRNFFAPESRWQFTGIRLAKDQS